jgi:hypothetical protein
MARRRAEARASDKDRRAKRSRSPSGTASLRRWIWNDVKFYGSVFGGVGTFVGLLNLSWLANISIVAGSMLVVFAFRRKSTLLILRRLYLQSAFYAYFYSVVFVVVVVLIGYFAFVVGKQAGYNSGVRSVLADLELPTRPLPPPRPRFPGDVNLDEYCRSEGPFQVMAPTDLGYFVQFEEGPPIPVQSPIPEGQKRQMEAALGPNYLLCHSRIRQPTPSTSVMHQRLCVLIRYWLAGVCGLILAR